VKIAEVGKPGRITTALPRWAARQIGFPGLSAKPIIRDNGGRQELLIKLDVVGNDKIELDDGTTKYLDYKGSFEAKDVNTTPGNVDFYNGTFDNEDVDGVFRWTATLPVKSGSRAGSTFFRKEISSKYA
jgi:hypothetical protein